MFRGEPVDATYMSADLNATQAIWLGPKVHKPSEQESRNVSICSLPRAEALLFIEVLMVAPHYHARQQ